MTSVSIVGSLNVGPYKGYYGRAEFDSETCSFHGEVTDTRDVITFVGNDPRSVAEEFKESVDVYLEVCLEQGVSPEKPFSGNFMVRTNPKLHRKLSARAAQHGISLNQLVVRVLESSLSESPLASITRRGQFVSCVSPELSGASLADDMHFTPSKTMYQTGVVVSRKASDKHLLAAS